MRLMLHDLYETMPWNEIDSVVFDVGNVLLTFDPKRLLENSFPGDTVLHERLMVRVFRSPYWVMLDHGTLSDGDAPRVMAGREKELEAPIRKLLAEWIDLKDVIDEGVFALKQCRAHGKKTYVLSNYNSAPFAFVDEKYDFFRPFEGKVVSSRVGLMKPDERIYRRLADSFGLVPERTLFIDDAPINIETALMLGWQGICYNEPGMLYRFFGEK